LPNEADTCRRYVVPKLQAAGWDAEPHWLNEQVTFTDGRIIIDECHCGSAKDNSNWQETLKYFKPAFQIGMTATLKRQDNIDTYPAIKRGLKSSRATAFRLSLVAWGSNWITLERRTALSYNPANTDRGFILLLLSDCKGSCKTGVAQLWRQI